MQSKETSLQDTFLWSAKNTESNGDITVYLINGIKLSGRLVNFDRYCIELTCRRGMNAPNFNQLIFKHAISTIVAKLD